MMVETAGGLLAGLLALGAWERHLRDRAHAAIPIRVHVNGTRGKSTVTRQIAAALRASGIPTLAKTTGTAARLVCPDGAELAVPRRSRPSIREQMWCLRRARALGVRAVVMECMAISPSLQATSERDMIRATLGVLTNARADHADAMGSALEDVATALASTMPRDGHLVLGPEFPEGAWLQTAAARARTRILRADPSVLPAGADAWPAWMRDNLAVALCAARTLGLDDAVAWPAIVAARPDPGAVATHHVRAAGRDVAVIDASAANDPDSLRRLLGAPPERQRRLHVFNHRADRPVRLRQFADSPIWTGADGALIVTGDPPDWATRRALAQRLGAGSVTVVARPRLADVLRQRLAREPDVACVVCCGNTRHFNPPALAAAIEDR